MSKSPFTPLADGRIQRTLAIRWLTLACLAMVAISAFLLFRNLREPTLPIRLSAGQPLKRRHAIAEVLRDEARAARLQLELIPTAGSEESLVDVARGEIDAALIQGGMERIDGVSQIAILCPEPIHVLVRPELVDEHWETLAGKRIHLGPLGSGTRRLGLKLLAFAGLAPGDFQDDSRSEESLRQAERGDLPDVLFTVSSLPSPLAAWLVQERGYRLKGLPFAEAYSRIDVQVRAESIPACMYQTDPAEPRANIPTVAPSMALVVRSDLPADAVARLMAVVYEGDFARKAALPALDAAELARLREFSLHTGAVSYLNRNEPLLSNDLIEAAENLRSFLVSAAIALFLLWRWSVRRKAVGLEIWLDRATAIELASLDLAAQGTWNEQTALEQEGILSRLKAEALEQFSAGKLNSDEDLRNFLLHIADVRSVLHGLERR